MTIAKLIQKLMKIPKKDRDKEVFLRKTTMVENIASLDKIEKDQYSFFGKAIDCFILDSES